jgi:hypothetical protein
VVSFSSHDVEVVVMIGQHLVAAVVTGVGVKHPARVLVEDAVPFPFGPSRELHSIIEEGLLVGHFLRCEGNAVVKVEAGLAR